MKAINVKSIEDSQAYCEGVLNDFETGIIDKAEAMVALWEYTVQLHNLFTASLEGKVQERLAELYEKSKKADFYCWDFDAIGTKCESVCELCFGQKIEGCKQ